MSDQKEQDVQVLIAEYQIVDGREKMITQFYLGSALAVAFIIGGTISFAVDHPTLKPKLYLGIPLLLLALT